MPPQYRPGPGYRPCPLSPDLTHLPGAPRSPLTARSLAYNDLGPEAGVALADALKTNATLQTLECVYLAGLVPWLGLGLGLGCAGRRSRRGGDRVGWVEILVGVGQGWDGERGEWFYVPR